MWRLCTRKPENLCLGCVWCVFCRFVDFWAYSPNLGKICEIRPTLALNFTRNGGFLRFLTCFDPRNCTFLPYFAV